VAARNALLNAPPYQVEKALKKLGSDLKTARLRRRLLIEDVAQKIGTSRYTVADAEKGKPSTGIAVYAALLWTYGFIERLADIVDPARDEEGLALSLHRIPARGARRRTIDNDF
jgi:transcriptional regulator with XRE-family HTH domain